VRVELVRHATLLVDYAGLRLLVDPLLAEPASLPPMSPAADERPNPLVALPRPVDQLLAGVDAVLVTHTHSDHWDPSAQAALPTATPVLAQPNDLQTIAGQGFTRVQGVEEDHALGDARITRVDARHGHGQMAQDMAPSSGYVLRAPGEPTLLLTGDTVFYEGLAATLAQHQPGVVVVNTGAAEFSEGGPITMTADDVVLTARAGPGALLVAVHLEAINHCGLTRAALGRRLSSEGLAQRVHVPADGDVITA